MKYQYFLLFLLVYFCGCDRINSETPTSSNTPTSGIKSQSIDTTVNPGDNFYAYSNNNWIEKYGSSIGSLLHKTSREVKVIIEEFASGNFEEGTDERKAGDLYKSFVNMDKRNEIGINPLIKEFARINKIETKEDLSIYFGYAAKNGFNPIYDFIVWPDFKNPGTYAAHTWQGGLGMPDRDYYLNTDEKTVSTREAYQAYVEKMISMVNLPDVKMSVSLIMDLETKLANIQMEKEKIKNESELYNMISADSLHLIMPNFNWNGYLEELDVEVNTLGQMCICMVDYSKALNDIIVQTDIEVWKTFLKWKVINSSAWMLNEEICEHHFNFYNKQLKVYGIYSQSWLGGVKIVNDCLGDVVGKVYVEKHFQPVVKERIAQIIEYILVAFEESINNQEWLSKSTKEEAVKKINNLTYKIGYPDKWVDYSELKINESDLYGNYKNSYQFNVKRGIDNLGQQVDKEEWSKYPQTVNASYSPDKNLIILPAAILQPPFFNMEAEEAVNYASIGEIVGHEISHALDDSGILIDANCMLKDWWTKEDKSEFKRRTSTLIDQYNAYEVLPGLYINGEYTLGENIADLVGLSMALKAYKMSLNGRKSEIIDGFNAEERFFIGYAQTWRSVTGEKKLRLMVNTSEHCPNNIRVNGVVRNMPEFYTAFNITPQDSLFIPLQQRAKIW